MRTEDTSSSDFPLSLVYSMEREEKKTNETILLIKDV